VGIGRGACVTDNGALLLLLVPSPLGDGDGDEVALRGDDNDTLWLAVDVLDGRTKLPP
jgi:hypothetical protein